MQILIVDDHDVLRHGVRALIEKQGIHTVCSEAADGLVAFQQSKELNPDLVIMDVTMPGCNGVDLTRLIRRENSTMKILGLSMHADRIFVGEMLRAGANGYVIKNQAAKELITAIETVEHGNTYLSPQIVDLVIGETLMRSPANENTFSLLTARERQVLQLLSEGHNVKEIAFRLEVSNKTIDTHKLNMMQKLDLTSVADLTRYAIKKGLSPL